MEQVFDCLEVSEVCRVKLVAIKLRKYASLWLENLKNQWDPKRNGNVMTWEKMKRELKRNNLLNNYWQDVFLKLHNFKQKELFVKEYTTKFDHLMMECALVEPEEQTIPHFLKGLKPEIGNIVQLQPNLTYGYVCKFSLKEKP